MKTEQIKTLFRPILTLILLITWIIFISQAITYPAMFQYLTAVAVAEWIGERAIKRIVEMKR